LAFCNVSVSLVLMLQAQAAFPDNYWLQNTDYQKQ